MPEATHLTRFDAAIRWIETTAAELGLGSPADVTPILERPWGAVLRVKTPDRVLFFKAEGPGAPTSSRSTSIVGGS